jgi:hypothetical protein
MAIRKRSSDSPRITPGKAKNAIAVAKVVAPAVLPLITPYVIKTAGAVRDRLDRYRARRLGVPVDDLAQYSGRGGALHARISGAAAAITELRERADSSGSSDHGFADQSETTLRQLAAAVRAAKRMPGPRRRAAQRAIATELDDLEERILHRLGV